MSDKTHRPDPDELLGRIEAEEAKARRGKLKIFFGSSAGVGKTYAMLSAAHEKIKEGLDVVVGLVETHKRQETEKLLEGLPLIPPLEIIYRGVPIHEFDLDAAKGRKPDILLVDELAHTNAPNMRHPKRWNDVMEILDAGIDVYTTLNVQHIESLSDIVSGTTGVWVKETVPDSIFDMADEIVLVDIDADELLRRLHEGKVYIAPHAKANAAENFFRKDKLIALRELALRRTAERVDAEKDAYYDSEGIHDRLPVAEKIMVCIGPDLLSPKLVRTGKRLAAALKAPWEAVYVQNEWHYRLNDKGRRSIETVCRSAERLGAKTVVLQGDMVDEELMTYARANKITKIIVGKPSGSLWRPFVFGTLADKIVHKSGNIDVYVVTGSPENNKQSLFKNQLFSSLEPKHYILSFLAALVCSALGIVLKEIITPTDQALIYLAGIVIVAAKFGRGPSLLYALLSVIFFNLYLYFPYDAARQAHPSYLITFLIMLITGYVIANQASRLRLQALFARQKERHTQMLYQITRELGATRGRKNNAAIVARRIDEMMDANATIWMIDSEEHLSLLVGNLPGDTYIKELSVMQWCFDNGKIAGRATDTMPSAAGLYFPLVTTSGSLGVLGVIPKTDERTFTQDEISTLETLVSLLTAALERVRAGEIAEQTRVRTESEKLRESLLKELDKTIGA